MQVLQDTMRDRLGKIVSFLTFYLNLSKNNREWVKKIYFQSKLSYSFPFPFRKRVNYSATTETYATPGTGKGPLSTVSWNLVNQ